MGNLLLDEVHGKGRLVQIRLLGGVEAIDDDGRSIDVGPPKCQAVLASLALSVGSAVPVSRIVELVWGDQPPRTADKTLQSYVTRLRKGLGPDSIERVGAAYRLSVLPESVDVERFQRHLSAGNPEEALAEWAGVPLAGLEVPGLFASVDGLVEQWLGAKEADLEQLVERDPTAAVAPLTELTAEHPFREGLWALLMTALYRDGRQADALGAYRRARGHLVDELGVEPGPRLREIEALILAHDERLDRAPVEPTVVTAPTGTVTFGFSDIEESPRLWAANRQAMAIAVRRHDELVRSIAADHGGHVFSSGGDSFGVAFNRASDAAKWAVTVQRAMVDEDWPRDAVLRVRIGLHTGEAEERANDYYGQAVNTVTRMAAAGHGGQTLVSSVTAGLLQHDDLRELGSFRFDGMNSDLNVSQLGDGEYPHLRTGESRRGNLPLRATRLYGRDQDLDGLTAAMAANPLVTVVGPGGIGKTRLALAAARLVEDDFSNGAWLVELADISSPSEVPRAVAEVLDVGHSPGRTITESIVAHLESRRTLLLLDNCEHVVQGAAELAAAIAAHCPATMVLATSREGLGLADEQLIVVGPLEVGGPAVELFAERARSGDAGFDLEAERDAVVEICRRLDGVPLAIELAAARARSLSPADLVLRLDDRLRLLTGGRRRSVERHRTLRATIQWSYELLTTPEQALFQRLSTFAGSFDLVAVEAVTADEDLPVEEINGLLGDLIDRSMVVVEAGAYGLRFRLLETMREFAAELLFEAGDSERLAIAHAAFVRNEVERIGGLLASNAEVDGSIQLAELWPNLRGAVDWALANEDTELVVAFLRPIALQVVLRRGLGEVADWAERLLAIAPENDEDSKAWGLLWAAMTYSMTQDTGRSRAMIEQYGNPEHVFVRYAFLLGVEDPDFGALEVGPLVIAEMHRRGEPVYARLFEMFTGAAMMSAGRFDEAEARHGSLAEILRAEGPPSILNWTLYLLGAAAAFQGNQALADKFWDESSSVTVPPRTNSPNEALAARTAFRQGRRIEAYRMLIEHGDELIEDNNLAGVVMIGLEFVNMMTELGRLSDAALVLGHFDGTGLLELEGPSFKLLLVDAMDRVAMDSDAAAVRADAAARKIDEAETLAAIRRVLSDLIGGDS